MSGQTSKIIQLMGEQPPKQRRIVHVSIIAAFQKKAEKPKGKTK